MTIRKWLLGAGLFVASAVSPLTTFAEDPVKKPEVPVTKVSLAKNNEVRIGFPSSIFRNVPSSLLNYTSGPFKKIVYDQTGMTSTVTHDQEWFKVAEKLVVGEYDIAVFLGHEFAWAKAKYPDLEAIVTAVPAQRKLQAFLVVKWDNPAKTVADLKGKKVGLPYGFVDQSILFYQGQVRKCLGEGQHFELANPDTIEDALNEVSAGKLSMTVADSAAWNYYKGTNPGRASNLRFLAESEVFPLACIAYHKNGLNPDALEKLKRGMASTSDNPNAKALLRMIRLQGFETPTTEYTRELKAISEAFPANYPVDLSKLK